MLDIYDYEPFKVFSSKDTGAPTLSKTNNSFSSVLKACLVTGYSDKTPVSGWEMVAEDTALNTRSFRSVSVLSTRTVFKVFNDVANAFSMSATIEGGASAFANIAHSKTMKDVVGVQDWYVIANDKSCYALIQTNTNEPWFAVIFFGDAYTTEEPKRLSALYGTNSVAFNESQIGLHRIPLTVSNGDVLVKDRFFLDSETTLISGENIFYPTIYKPNSTGVTARVFLPGYVVSSGAVEYSFSGYTKLLDASGDVLFFTTTWGVISQFGIALKGVV